MDVTFGKAGLKESWQEDFPETTSCCKCGKECRIGFVAHELSEDAYVYELHPNEPDGEGFWLHDACCVAVYFCRARLNPTALYNQA